MYSYAHSTVATTVSRRPSPPPRPIPSGKARVRPRTDTTGHLPSCHGADHRGSWSVQRRNEHERGWCSYHTRAHTHSTENGGRPSTSRDIDCPPRSSVHRGSGTLLVGSRVSPRPNSVEKWTEKSRWGAQVHRKAVVGRKSRPFLPLSPWARRNRV